MASDGFYSFAGGKPIKILEKLQGFIENVDNEDAKGVYFNGKYYCNLNIKSDDDLVRNVMLCYDTKSGDFTIGRGLQIIDFCVFEGENYSDLLFICDGKDCIGALSNKAQFFNDSLQKIWHSGK